jgi:hypothetical protein
VGKDTGDVVAEETAGPVPLERLADRLPTMDEEEEATAVGGTGRQVLEGADGITVDRVEVVEVQDDCAVGMRQGLDLFLEQADGGSIERPDQRESLDPVPPVAEDGEVNVGSVNDLLLHPISSIRPLDPAWARLRCSDRGLGFALREPGAGAPVWLTLALLLELR